MQLQLPENQCFPPQGYFFLSLSVKIGYTMLHFDTQLCPTEVKHLVNHKWGVGKGNKLKGAVATPSLLGLMAKIKCSICSYQFNIWYVAHWVTHILIWFLALGQGSEVYFTLTTGCLGVALQPSAAHQWPKERTITTHIYMSMHGSTYMHPYVCIPMHTTIADVHA